MSQDEAYVQLQMVWPKQRLAAPPTVQLPSGYRLRTYQPGDEPAFYRVMALAGWPGWDDKTLQPWLVRIPPASWFMVLPAGSDAIAATAMGLHDHTDLHPFGGELGWVAGDPAHSGQGLGLAVCAAVTRRLLAMGYVNLHLYTEHWRLAALKIYLKLGYQPLLHTPEMPDRWRAVCQQLDWPFTPAAWQDSKI